MAVLTREQILARKVAGSTAAVELEGGGEVIVRGLTRGEGHVLGQLDDAKDMEAHALHFGMVDPALSLDDARTWLEQDASGELQKVANKIQELSGTAPGQAKGYSKSVPRGRRAR